MRYLKSFLVGLGMYLLAAYAYDVLGGLYLQVRYRHELTRDPVLPLTIGYVVAVAAFVAGFYWMFRRTSARN
jgi:hypothetical protein